MTDELDTFLVALYTIIDDLYQAHVAEAARHRPGVAPVVSDSEVLTLAVCAQWYGRSESGFLRYVDRHWRRYFPRQLEQSAFNRRVRGLHGVLTMLVPRVAAALGAVGAPYQVVDGVGVPLARRTRGQRHRQFANEAAIGRGGVDKDWYYGCKALLRCTDQGLITGFVVGPASTEERWLADALMCWSVAAHAQPWGPDDLPPAHRNKGRFRGPTGPLWPRLGAGDPTAVPIIADAGFKGAVWSAHWRADYGATVLTADTYHGDQVAAARRQHHAWRQIIETVNNSLEHTLHLLFPAAHSWWGLRARLAAKFLAHNLGIWLNRLFGRHDLALATLFPL